MTTTPGNPQRTLGELSIDDLLRSALREALALGDGRERDLDMLQVYSGSIAARISVALDKLSNVRDLLQD